MTPLSVADLSVSAVDGPPLVRDVTFEVAPGETVLICGPSGSGKTLLLKALKGLLAGRRDLVVDGTVERSGRVGYVAQAPRQQLVRRTVRTDVAFGPENWGVAPREIEDRIQESARALDATALLDRRTRELSGGEVAIVAILGVLVMEPDIVLLDEPLAALDHPNTQLVLDAIDRLTDTDVAMVIAEHDVSDLLDRGDRAILLDDGEIDTIGPPPAMAVDLHYAGVTIPFEAAVEVERAVISGSGPDTDSTGPQGTDRS